MARTRTIKPRFFQTESMSRVGCEARLPFILPWTAADDEGRAFDDQASLAALLYPRDPDAATSLAAWLAELEHEGCIERYVVDAIDYLRVVRRHDHRAIRHPTASRLPPSPSEPPSDSRIHESRKEFREMGANALHRRDFDGPGEIRENFEDSAFRENPDDQREVTEARVLREIARILAKSEARGGYALALRAAKPMGRRLGQWAGRGRTQAAHDEETNSPPPDVLLAEGNAAHFSFPSSSRRGVAVLRRRRGRMS